LIAPLVVVLFINDWQIGWRPLFYSIGIGTLITTALFVYFSKGKEITDKSDSKQDYQFFKEEIIKTLQIFKNVELFKFVIWATLVGGFGFFAITAFRSFIPTLLIEKGYSFARANQLYAIIAISGLITKLGIAWLADKFGTKRTLFLILILNFIFFFLFTAQIGHLLIIISLIIFGITFNSHNTLINAYVLRLFPDEYQGTGFGLFSTLYTAIYSLGPIATGFFADKFNLVIGMRVSILGIVIATFLLGLFKYLIDDEVLNKNH
jgi:MFS family permease